MPRPDTMFDSVNDDDVGNMDEACWESARSSWIYMEMEPRHRASWLTNNFTFSSDSANQELNCSRCSDSTSFVMTSCDTSRTIEDADSSIEFIEGLTFGSLDNYGDYYELEDEDKVGNEHYCFSSAGLVSNDNFILRKDVNVGSPCSGNIWANPKTPNPVRGKTSAARRSVSLDSYPHQKNSNHLVKQSETVNFPHVLRALPLEPQYPQRLSKYCLTSPQLPKFLPNLQCSPHKGPSLARSDLDADRESMMSVCTMATMSTAGSCNSLYRIPAKLRKLSTSSSSGTSSWSAVARNKNCTDPGKFSADSSAYLLPKLLQDMFSYLWCENPDRDPFNTFSVSETDLTAAIAHLEQQLSGSTRQKDKESQATLFSNLVHKGSSPAFSTSGDSEFSHAPTPVTGSSNLCEDDSAEPSKSLPFRVQFIMESYCNIYMTRKQDLRELKMLQKQENKQITDLQYKNHVALEAKQKKFESDGTSLKKIFDQDLDVLNKQQKQLIERAEQAQQADMKNAAKKLKAEQDKELKLFREKQKQEMKLLKQELDLLPRDNKKDMAQKLRETKQIEMEEKERTFLGGQMEKTENQMRQLAAQHRQKIALLESQCLQQKQQLLRTREDSVWEMEKTQYHERHQLVKTQLKDMFFVKRHQMLTRHQKEMENLRRYNQAKEEEMLNRHAMERRRLPKFLKSEAKTRAQMFKQSLRLSNISTPEDDKTKIKHFEESEKKRVKSEQLRQEEKHKRQLKALRDKNDATIKELEQLQAEKRKMLMEQETQRIKELDDQFGSEMNKWKAMLIPRKQALEDQFQRETEEQQSFYADVISSEGTIPAMPSMRSNTVRSKGKDSTANTRHSTII